MLPTYAYTDVALTCLALGLVFAVLALVLLQHVRRAVLAGKFGRVDLPVMEWVHRHGSDLLTPVMRWASRLMALPVALPAALLSLCWLLWRGNWQGAAGLFAALLLPSVLIPATKAHYRHPRPDVPWALAYEATCSYPSGHAAFSTTIYGMAAFLLDQSGRLPDWGAVVAAVAALLVLLTGYSRVYLGVHYPSDVLGGYALGMISVLTGVGTVALLHAVA
ncbi:MAG: phosphatase PAP2 family protein [Mycobacterium leprae]